MNVVDTHFLTTDPETIASVKSVMTNSIGKVFVTSRLGLDMMESDETVECFTATTDGQLSGVKQYEGSEWDFVLVGMMMGGAAIAVVENENVHGAYSRMRDLVNEGKTLPQAFDALLPA